MQNQPFFLQKELWAFRKGLGLLEYWITSKVSYLHIGSKSSGDTNVYNCSKGVIKDFGLKTWDVAKLVKDMAQKIANGWMTDW